MKSERQLKDRERREAAQMLADMRAVLAMAEGRRLLWALIEDCGVFKDIWDPSARIHFNEGRRAQGLRLIAWIKEADAGAFARILGEATARDIDTVRLIEALKRAPAAAGEEDTDG